MVCANKDCSRKTHTTDADSCADMFAQTPSKCELVPEHVDKIESNVSRLWVRVCAPGGMLQTGVIVIVLLKYQRNESLQIVG